MPDFDIELESERLTAEIETQLGACAQVRSQNNWVYDKLVDFAHRVREATEEECIKDACGCCAIGERLNQPRVPDAPIWTHPLDDECRWVHCPATNIHERRRRREGAS